MIKAVSRSLFNQIGKRAFSTSHPPIELTLHDYHANTIKAKMVENCGNCVEFYSNLNAFSIARILDAL